MQQYQQANYPWSRSCNMARQSFPEHTIIALSICQIVLGGLAVILGIVTLVIGCQLSYIGAGMWCGILFIVSGCIGLVSARKKTRAMIIASMVLSIVSASLSVAVLGVISIVATTGENDAYAYTSTGGRIVVDVFLVLVAISEATVAAISAACCGRLVCCFRPKNVMYGVPLEMQILGDGTLNEGIQLASHPCGSSSENQTEVTQNCDRMTQKHTYAVLNPIPHNLDLQRDHQYGMPGTTYQSPMMPFHDQPLQHPSLQQWVQPPDCHETTRQSWQTGSIHHPSLQAPSPQQLWTCNSCSYQNHSLKDCSIHYDNCNNSKASRCCLLLHSIHHLT
ncbi:uncharacterized protein [Ptychodera flava]|uniref:uncharacterized protein n=1 Tax=Ptychodera flava TaxID=63121 RepID=UPI00396A3085